MVNINGGKQARYLKIESLSGYLDPKQMRIVEKD